MWLLVAGVSFAGGTALALNHPLGPMAALVGFGVWCIVAAWRPGLWLFVVPALLPVLNFSPWTGWLIFEEFDILLLGALAGGYFALARSSQAVSPVKQHKINWALLVLMACSGVWALWRGFLDAGGFAFDWYAGYTDPLNSLRIFKSLGFALLFTPLLQHALNRSKVQASRRLSTGMVAGLSIVTFAALWERVAFPGLLDFSDSYRTVALFWEMHVGGAAIDVYLAMAAPFAAWALFTARRPIAWAGAAALALLAGYVCLTTFSRGVYLAVAVPLALLGTLHRADRSEAWRVKGNLILVVALVAQVMLVLGGGSFMKERLDKTDRDIGSRLDHWGLALGLLDGTGDWWLGKGLGRLPANYADRVPSGEFSGAVKLRSETTPAGGENHFVAVHGPQTDNDLGGKYELTQRLRDVSDLQHLVDVDVRVSKPTVVRLALCQRHLLYNADCQVAYARMLPVNESWQNLKIPLKGAALESAHWFAPRPVVFSVSVVSAGGVADFDNLSLLGRAQKQLLQNRNFSDGLAHWFPSAQGYFVPWHMDNLYLDMLFDRGTVGLLTFVALVAYALGLLVSSRRQKLALSPFLATSLGAVLLIGLISSVADAPRVAFLMYLLIFFSAQATQYDDQD